MGRTTMALALAAACLAGCASAPATRDAATDGPIERRSYAIADLVAGKEPIPRPGCCVLMAPPVRRIEFPGVRVGPAANPAPPVVALPEPRRPYLEYPDEVLLRGLREKTGIGVSDPRGYRLTLDEDGRVLADCPPALHARIEEELQDRRRRESHAGW
jgi:hypothetical protein